MACHTVPLKWGMGQYAVYTIDCTWLLSVYCLLSACGRLVLDTCLLSTYG